MRTITITKTYYQFHELSEDAKQKAIEKLYDINVDYDWWQFTCDDAENIGLKIEGFDIYRHEIYGRCTDYTVNVANAILKDHGETTETYKLAEQYMQDRKELTTKLLAKDCQNDADLLQWPGCLKDWETIIDYEPEEIEEDDYEDLNVEFERSLKEEYLSMLRKEYEYFTSEEAIIETIEANEYEFDEEGNLQ